MLNKRSIHPSMKAKLLKDSLMILVGLKVELIATPISFTYFFHFSGGFFFLLFRKQLPNQHTKMNIICWIYFVAAVYNDPPFNVKFMLKYFFCFFYFFDFVCFLPDTCYTKLVHGMTEMVWKFSSLFGWLWYVLWCSKRERVQRQALRFLTFYTCICNSKHFLHSQIFL